jgi:hypothetical protein
MITIILAVLVVFLFYLGNKWITKNCYTDPPNQTFFIHERLHGDPEKEVDEHSPEHIDLDKSLKIINLRNKLKKIESEKNDVDLNYQDESGR